jgi:hypothetical protein
LCVTGVASSNTTLNLGDVIAVANTATGTWDAHPCQAAKLPSLRRRPLVDDSVATCTHHMAFGCDGREGGTVSPLELGTHPASHSGSPPKCRWCTLCTIADSGSGGGVYAALTYSDSGVDNTVSVTDATVAQNAAGFGTLRSRHSVGVCPIPALHTLCSFHTMGLPSND